MCYLFVPRGLPFYSILPLSLCYHRVISPLVHIHTSTQQSCNLSFCSVNRVIIIKTTESENIILSAITWFTAQVLSFSFYVKYIYLTLASCLFREAEHMIFGVSCAYPFLYPPTALRHTFRNV